MVQHVRIEDVGGLPALDSIRDLSEGSEVEADCGLDSDSCVMVRANDAGVVFMNRPWPVHRVVHHISTWTKLNLYFSPQLFGPQSVTSVV